MLSAAIKRAMHRDICANPVLHGLVLNLYLNGEQYPHRVDDYFPAQDWLEPELAGAMQAHQRDEDKHIALYAKTLRELQQPVTVLPLADVYNEVIRKHTPVSFAIDARDSLDERRCKLAHFLAHLHFLETRVARSLEYHHDACARSPSPYPEKSVQIILADECKHAAYTREAVLDLVPTQLATAILSVHRRAEQAADADFSCTQLMRLLREHRARFPRLRRDLYRASVRLLALLSRFDG